MIGGGTFPVARLTEVFRQAARSRIIVSAHRINEGVLPDLDPPEEGESDFYFVPGEDPEDAWRRSSSWCRCGCRAVSDSIRSATSRSCVR